MKRKLKKNNNFAIYNFPYYKRNRGFLRIFVAKALLAFITCFYGAFYFSEMLNMGDEAVFFAFTAGFSCVLFFLLFGLFGRRYVLTFTLASIVLFLKPLGEWGKDFMYHVLTVADGSIINADRLLKNADKVDPLPFLLVLSAVFGMLFALCSHHRFNPELILTYFAIMVIPSFLSQHTSYKPELGVFMAGMAALWSSSLAFSASYSLAAGGVTSVSLMDRQYRESVRRVSPINRIKSDNIHFNKFFSDSAVIFISLLLTVSITAACFPLEGNLKLDRVIQKITESVKSVGEWGSGLIQNINYSPYKGFFSADGGSINISNGINPNDTPQSNTPVLEVFTQNKDKLYLRGDIGYSFDGRRWRSISDIDFDGISYYITDYGISEHVYLKDVLDSYTPEIELYLANRMLEQEYTENILNYDFGFDPAPYSAAPLANTQNVKINYLQKMNTVLFAGIPLIYSFRESENYSVEGDFIALADRGRINSMETLIFYYPYSITVWSREHVFGQPYDADIYGGEEFEVLPVSEEDYKTYLKAYQRFVYEYYTGVPDDEMQTISDFCDKVNSDLYGSDSHFDLISSFAADDMYQRASLARLLEDYFTGGEYKYKYSLSADNFSGEDTPLHSFLFKTKAGHCAMYASAMCLMLRNYGVPARYVTGFTVGGVNNTETDEGYKYTVLQKNLHAWVEVYYDNVGWVPYDPTPGGGMSAYDPIGTAEATTTSVTTTTTPPETTTRTTVESSATTTAEREETTTALPSTDSDDPFSGGENGGGMIAREFFRVMLWIIGIPAAIFLIVMAVKAALTSLNKKQSRKMKFFKSGDSQRAVREMLELSLKLLELNGIRRQKGETPEEFGFRADKTLKSGNVFRDAVPFYERSEFDNEPEFTKDEQLLVYGSVTKLLRITLDRMGSLKRFVTRVKLFRKRTLNS